MGDDGVEVVVSWFLFAQCPLADVVEGFIVQTEGQVGMLDELMQGQSGVVRLNDRVRYLCGVGNALVEWTQYFGQAHGHTFGDGRMDHVLSILSGNSSRSLESRLVPRPEPVPPPRE